MKKIIVILFCVALAGLIGFRAYKNYSAKKKAMNQPVEEKIIPVETTVPRAVEITDKIKASGNLQADSEITLYSKVSGKVSKSLVKMGTVVQPGQVVAIVIRDEVGYEFNPYELKSDVKGIVARLLQNPGAAVNPNVPLMTIVDVDLVKAVAAVDERKIRHIQIGQPAQVRLEAYPGEAFQARVTNISPLCNPVSRTVDIEVSIPNAQHRLKPGMYAEVELTESKRTSIVVPLAAVVERAGQKYVFLAQNDQASLLAVTTGEIVGNEIEIISGLKGDEVVIATGAAKLNDRDKIKVAAEKIQ